MIFIELYEISIKYGYIQFFCKLTINNWNEKKSIYLKIIWNNQLRSLICMI